MMTASTASASISTACPGGAELARAGARPPLLAYTRELLARARFVTALSGARASVGFARNALGQAWQLLNPLLQVGVYYLIFGVLLHTTRGVHNFLAFLTLGLAFFGLMSNSLTQGARAVLDATGLVSALHFPRAVLPVATVLVSVHRLLYSLMVVVFVLLTTGERPDARWLLIGPALLLQILFCLGVAFVAARLSVTVIDLPQLLPYLVRVWMYMSGVMYSVDRFTAGHAHWVHVVLDANPGRVFVDLARYALLDGSSLYPGEWLVAVAWAAGSFLVGYVVFWSGEESYGRV